MANTRNLSANGSSAMPKTDDATVFNIPIGKLGLPGSLLISVTFACISFFFACFLSIVGVTIYDAATGKSLQNLAISYQYIAAPVGVVALFVSLVYLLSIWIRHKFSHAA
ncbi:MAG: hypothetical protein ABI076_04335 [Acidobacteriaceae bacterium]